MKNFSMKTLNSITILIFIVVVLGCNSDDDRGTTETTKTFEQLTKNDIEDLESTMSDTSLNASNDTGILWGNGKILLYKTNRGRFGKLKILNIDLDDNYKLTIEVVTYASDGLVYNSNSFLEVPGTWLVDLDELVLIGTRDGDEDFWWNRIGANITKMDTENGFVFMEYNLN